MAGCVADGPVSQNPQVKKLSATQESELEAAARSWLDYYYRPLLFPDEYFKHYKATNRYLTLKQHILPKLWPEFVAIFLENLKSLNTFTAYENLRKEPTKENAQKLFSEFYYFIDFAYQNNTTMQQLRNAQQIPFAGRLVAIFENAMSKDMRAKAEKVRVFLNNLFLNDYQNWLDTLGENNGRL